MHTSVQAGGSLGMRLREPGNMVQGESGNKVWHLSSGRAQINHVYNNCDDHTLINYSFNALRAVMYSMYSNIHKLSRGGKMNELCVKTE